jgi:hypothetical protein
MLITSFMSRSAAAGPIGKAVERPDPLVKKSEQKLYSGANSYQSVAVPH